jgi:hypothetical protein
MRAANISPTPSEIAAVSYQLWLDRGCPVGSDQEDWFRAEALLKAAIDTPTESEMVGEFAAELWEGHWEVWEREWANARWIWDVRAPVMGVATRARAAGKAA